MSALSIAVAPGRLPSVAAQPPREEAALEALRDLAGGPVTVERRDDGRVRFVGAPTERSLSGPGEPEQRAREIVDHLAPAFGVAPSELREERTSHPPGRTIRYRQHVAGVPVFAGEVTVQTDGEGRVRSLLGETTAARPPTVPAIDAATAATAAREHLARSHSAAPERATAAEPSLWIFDPELIGSPVSTAPRLVWRTEVELDDGTEPVRDLVLVDATTGTVAFRAPLVHLARDRRICDRGLIGGTDYECFAPYTRVEGQAATGIADVDKAYDYSGDVYDFYLNRFGRDSLDNAGLPLVSTVRWCPFNPCTFANAGWTGTQMVYGPGFAQADDVVGHELTHGVIQYEAQLVYAYQSGAINESLSDIFGELIDLTNGNGTDTPGARWILGEDLPTGTRTRSMSNPPASATPQPDRMRSPLYYSGYDDSGGVHRNSGVGNKAAYLIVDGGTFNGATISGIGIPKAAALFYDVMTQFLVSGSDYEDLYLALNQACANRVGLMPLGITVNDCAQVRKATDATELNLQPITGAAVPDAPMCDVATQPVTTIWSDDMENPASGKWSLGGQWQYFDGSGSEFPEPMATSGITSLRVTTAPSSADQRLTKSTNVAIPTGTSTYLRFNHAFNFLVTGGSATVEGGVLEYSTNNGASWLDAGSLITENGYNGVIQAGFGSPLAGRTGFVRDTFGFVATRVDLTPLAGSNVRFRFRAGTTPDPGFPVWFVDDVQVYSCAPALGSYHPLTPARLLDTRDGTGIGGTPAPVTAGAWIDLLVAGRGGVPATGVSAVVMNVTAVGPTAPSHATIWPTGIARPLASNLNYTTGQIIPNLVKVGVGKHGRVSLFNNSGGVHFVADVVGWYDDGTGGDEFTPIAPARLLDTRDGTGGTTGKVVGGTSIELDVTDVGGVPADATAVVINVTATEATAPSHVTVWPSQVAMPLASNLNFLAGQTIPNLVIAKVGSNGKIRLYNNAGAVHLIADVTGYYRPTGSSYAPVKPSRLLDTRDGTGGSFGRLGAGTTIDLLVAGRGGVPANATAVALNVTAVDPTAASHVTVWPSGQPVPATSNLNVVAGQTIPNLVIVGLGPDGKVRLRNNSGGVFLLADVVGYYH